jgi:hypothetical protein
MIHHALAKVRTASRGGVSGAGTGITLMQDVEVLIGVDQDGTAVQAQRFLGETPVFRLAGPRREFFDVRA